MDALNDIEVIEILSQVGATKVKAESCGESASSRGLSNPSGASCVTPSPAKKKPRLSHPLKQGVKTEFGEADASPLDGEDSCYGCNRSRLSGRCFLNPEEGVHWSDARSRWCSDCYNVWRTHWSQTHTLSLFLQWLQAPANQSEWIRSLLAYWSLKAEGHTKITSGMLSARIQANAIVLKLVGVPSVPFHVAMLSDLAKSGASPQTINPNHLLTCAGPSGSRLAVLMPNDDQQSGDVAVRRPGGDSVSYLGHRRALMCSSTEDTDILQEVFASEAGVICAVGSAAKEEAAARPVTGKLEAKFNVLRSAASNVLVVFASNKWESTKESAFSKVVTDLQHLKQKAEDEADSVVLDSVRLWYDGMAAAKRMAQQWNEYQKTMKVTLKKAKLLDLGGTAAKLGFFLSSVAGVVVAPSFALLCRKAALATAWSEQASLCKAVEAALGGSALREVFASLHREEVAASKNGKARTCPDVWLQSQLQACLVEVFTDGLKSGDKALGTRALRRPSVLASHA